MKKLFLLTLVALAAAMFTPTASALGGVGVTTRTTQFSTNTTTLVIAAAAQSNLAAGVSVVISKDNSLFQASGQTLFARFASTNSATAQVGFAFAPSYDGTNFATRNKLWFISALNGTTGVVDWTNLPPTLLNNVKALKLTDVTNGHTASLFVSNVVHSASP